MEGMIWSGVRSLAVKGILGAYDWERSLQREYLVDFAVGFKANAVRAEDSLAHVPDYAALADAIRSFACASSYQLIESLLCACATMIFRDYGQVEALSMRIRKPAAVEQSEFSYAALDAVRNQDSWIITGKNSFCC